MRRTFAESWVVYENARPGDAPRPRSVCEAGEWAALQALRPGALTLVRAGIASEPAAERLARGTAGDPPKRKGAV